MNMYDTIKKTIDDYPNITACSLDGINITYEQLNTRINQAKARCVALGIQPHDKVALVLPNIIETIALFYALNDCDVTVVMLHPLSSPAMLKKRCDYMDVKYVFVLDVLLKKYKRVFDKEKVIVISMAKSLRGYKKLALSILHAWNPYGKKYHKIPTYYRETKTKRNNKDAVILFSSGTTGDQKAISLSNEALNALVIQMKLCINPEVGKDSMYCVLPFFHGFGLAITMHTVLAIGGRCVLIPRLQKKTMIKQLLKEKPSYLAGVPYLYRLLIKDKDFRVADLSFIKQAFVGGELVQPQLIEKFNQMLKINGSSGSLQVGYGTTECVTAVSLTEPFDITPNKVGKPLKGNRFMIIKEDGTFAHPYETGEILLTGPTLMNGYYNNTTLTNQVLQTHDGVLYYHSSDIGHMDDKGSLYFSHRKDELMKVKGFFVNPLEVEQALYTINGCLEAKVFVNANEKLCAMMVFDQKESELLRKKQSALACEHLDHWSVPSQYYVVSEIPKNEMRKYDIKRINQSLANQKEIEFLQEWSL